MAKSNTTKNLQIVRMLREGDLIINEHKLINNLKRNKMTQEQMTQVVMNRATEMLKDSKINAIYQSFKTEGEAKDWIIKSALATLIIPVSERKKVTHNVLQIGDGCLR